MNYYYENDSRAPCIGTVSEYKSLNQRPILQQTISDGGVNRITHIHIILSSTIAFIAPFFFVAYCSIVHLPGIVLQILPLYLHMIQRLGPLPQFMTPGVSWLLPCLGGHVRRFLSFS